jgi:hypothetical protein
VLTRPGRSTEPALSGEPSGLGDWRRSAASAAASRRARHGDLLWELERPIRPGSARAKPSPATTWAEHRAGGRAVRGAPSGAREPRAEGPTLTARPPAPQFRLVVAGSLVRINVADLLRRVSGTRMAFMSLRLATAGALPR